MDVAEKFSDFKKKFPIWRVGQEEAWLESMAQNGWLLRKVLPEKRMHSYTFESVEAFTAQYKIDLIDNKRSKEQAAQDEYEAQSIRDGWKIQTRMDQKVYWLNNGGEKLEKKRYDILGYVQSKTWKTYLTFAIYLILLAASVIFIILPKLFGITLLGTIAGELPELKIILLLIIVPVILVIAIMDSFKMFGEIVHLRKLRKDRVK